MSELAKVEGRSLVKDLAANAGLEPANFYAAVKRQSGCNGATDEDFAALLMTAQAYDLNPVMRELWLLDTGRGRIRAVISHDGYFKIMVRHPDYLNHTYITGEDSFGVYGEVSIFTKAATAAGLPPYTHREYLKEVQKRSGPWQTHTMRMLRGRTISQGVRHRFAIAAPDPDEAVIEDAAPAEVVDVTPAIEIESIVTADPDDRMETHDEERGITADDFDADESARLDAEDAKR